MTRDFLTIDDFDLSNRTVLVRADINTPIDPTTGRILDDTRIQAHATTLRELRNSKVVIMAHQSRPGKKDFTPLREHAYRLSRILGKKVSYIDSLFGSNALSAVKNMRAGDVILLENTRFYSEEVALKDDKSFPKTLCVKALAPLADFYVNDAFSAAHRSQTSLIGFVEYLPCLAGRLMEKELTMIGKAIGAKEKPRVAVLGGLKVDDSIGVMENMLQNDVMDKILTAGMVGNIFLMAKGYDLGPKNTEFIEKELDGYKKLVDKAKELVSRHGEQILIPMDLGINVDGERKRIEVEELPTEHMISDIGLDTTIRYANEIKDARTIVLNGPSGVFEQEEFALGTVEIFNAIGDSKGFSVVGGGHTNAVVKNLGLRDKVNHVSTGGGALINFLGGKKLPVVESLKQSKKYYEEGKYHI